MDSTSSNVAVDARGVLKRFGEVEALRGVDLRVPAGGCFGLLGPNGAGKTTLISILATLATPDAGEVAVLGHALPAERARVREAIGIVFQEPSLDRALTGRELLDLHARIYHLPARRERVAEALDAAGLAADADRPVGGWSGGMRRRLELARGLLHRPRLLFLDEPTVGLDPAARAAIWRRLRALAGGGETTLLLTTHSMEEADALCGRLAILDRGRVVAEGSPDALKAALGGDVVVLTLRDAEGAVSSLRALTGVREVAHEPASERLLVTTEDAPRRLPALLDAARPHGVESVTLHRPSLEAVFLHHTGHVFEAAP